MEKTEQSLVLSMAQMQEYGSEMLKHVSEICEREKIPYVLFFGSMLGAVRHRGPIPWDYDIDIGVPENELERFVAVMEQQLPEKYWVDFRSEHATPMIFPRIGLSGYDTHYLHIDVYRLVGFPDSMQRSKWIVKLGWLLLELRLVKTADLDYYEGQKKRRIRNLRRFLYLFSPSFFVKRYDALCKRYPYESASKVGLNACKEGIQFIYNRETFDDTILVDYLDYKVRIPRSYDAVLRSFYKDYMQLPSREHIDSEMKKQYRLKPWKRKNSV